VLLTAWGIFLSIRNRSAFLGVVRVLAVTIASVVGAAVVFAAISLWQIAVPLLIVTADSRF